MQAVLVGPTADVAAFERGGKQFKGATEADIRAEMAAYAAQLKQYRSFNIVDTSDGFGIGTCGTPHVEIYRPDGTLLAVIFDDTVRLLETDGYTQVGELVLARP